MAARSWAKAATELEAGSRGLVPSQSLSQEPADRSRVGALCEAVSKVSGQAGFLDILAQGIKSFQNTKQTQERSCFLKKRSTEIPFIKTLEKNIGSKPL